MKTKTPSSLAAAITLLVLGTLPVHANDLNAIYEQGRAYYNAGQFELAREKLAIVAAKSPNHVPTRAMLAQINQSLGANNATLRNSYEKIIIEKVDFDKVLLSEAIEAVRILTRKATDQKVTPNIILKSPELSDRPISIQLTNVPLTEVLNYLAQLTGSKLVYDKTAVLFTSQAG